MALFVAAGILVVGQMYVVLPMLAPMARSLGTPASALTAATTVFGVAYAAGFLCGGPLADRFGQRTTIAAGLGASGVLTAAIAAAPDGAALVALRAVQGFCAAAFLPSALSYVALRIRPEARVMATSCVTTSAFAAAVIMQAFAQVLVGMVGWQGVFLICGTAIAGLGALARATLRPAEPVGGGGAGAGGFAQALRAMARIVARPEMLLLYAAAAILLGAFAAMYTAIALAGPAAVAGSPAAMLALRLSGIPAMIAIPLLAPVLKRRAAPGRVLAGLLAAAAAAAGAALAGGSALELGLVLLVFLAALVMAAPTLVETIAASAQGSPGVATAFYGFAMFLGASIGSLLVASGAGLGFTALMLGIAALLLAAAALVALSRRLARAATRVRA